MPLNREKRSEYSRRYYQSHRKEILARLRAQAAESPRLERDVACIECGAVFRCVVWRTSKICSAVCREVRRARHEAEGRAARNVRSRDRMRAQREADQDALGLAVLPKVCVECGVGFDVPRKSHRQKTCSRKCAESRAERLHRETLERRKIANYRRPSDRPDLNRKKHLRKRFGLTPEDYDTLLAQQGGACAICAKTTPGGRGSFHVDHDHATGRVRGLLCFVCNSGLGKFLDDPALLLKAVEYLCSAAAPTGLRVVT